MIDNPQDTRVSLTPRAAEIAQVARELLEEEGLDALSMRNIGARLGIRAASLYEHFADKRAVENAIVAAMMWEQGDVERRALADNPGEPPVVAVFNAFRRYAHEHPHLYRLAMQRDLDRAAPDVRNAEEYMNEPLRTRYPAPEQSALLLAMWAFTHGVLDLELTGRLSSLPVQNESSLGNVWTTGMRLFAGQLDAAPATA